MALTAWLLGDKLFNSIHETREALKNLVWRGFVAKEVSGSQLEDKRGVHVERALIIRINSVIDKNSSDDVIYEICEFSRLDLSVYPDASIGCNDDVLLERKRKISIAIVDQDARDTGVVLFGFLDDFALPPCP